MAPQNKATLAGLALAGLLWGAFLAPIDVVAGDRFDEADVEAIEDIIRGYLLENPEILSEAKKVLDERKAEKALQRGRELIAENYEWLTTDSHSFVAGNPDGDVTMIEFFDYRCPYCKGWLPKVAELIDSDGNIRFIYKEYPVLGPDSQVAARAALAAIPQGKYREFHYALMTSRGALTDELIMDVAMEVGMDPEKLLADMADPKFEAAVNDNFELGKALDLLGTPTFVVGGQFFEPWLSLDELKAMIAQIRAAKVDG